MTSVEITIEDANNGRDTKFSIDGDKTIGEAIEKGYGQLGEKRRPSDHFADGKGNDLGDRLDKPVSTIELDREGEATIQITGPSGGAYIFLIRGLGVLTARPHQDLARSQFEEDMARAEAGGLVRRYGWELQPDYAGLRLRVGMWSLDEQAGRGDDYHLDLDMSYYRRHPPGVTFVNPGTRSFDPRTDMRWLPAMASSPKHIGIAYHPAYSLDNGVTKQMVCNSMVLEYYQTVHSPRPETVWDPGRHTLFATLNVLQTMLTAPYYGGRSA